jgi:hypothetical protein
MKEYKVLQISQQPPRQWDGPKGTIYYINVMLEGHQKAVSIGKKSPNALKAGDTVYGEITETQYDTDKFTAGQNPGGGGGYAKKPQDNTTMYVSYAKDILVAMLAAGKDLKDYDAYITKIADSGKKLKELVEAEPKKDWVKPEVREKLETIPNDEVPVEAYDNVDVSDDEPVNLDDIPF